MSLGKGRLFKEVLPPSPHKMPVIMLSKDFDEVGGP
jgi:hypothetical protein